MKKRNFSIYFVLLAFAVSLMSLKACTDLSETIYSELNEENFYNNRVEVMQAVLRPFPLWRPGWRQPARTVSSIIAECSPDRLQWRKKGGMGSAAGDIVLFRITTWPPRGTGWNHAG